MSGKDTAQRLPFRRDRPMNTGRHHGGTGEFPDPSVSLTIALYPFSIHTGGSSPQRRRQRIPFPAPSIRHMFRKHDRRFEGNIRVPVPSLSEYHSEAPVRKLIRAHGTGRHCEVLVDLEVLSSATQRLFLYSICLSRACPEAGADTAFFTFVPPRCPQIGRLLRGHLVLPFPAW